MWAHPGAAASSSEASECGSTGCATTSRRSPRSGRRPKYGLEAHVDTAGNHSAVLPADGPTLLLGSHLDSVVNGGRYDGALGVVAELHVLLALRKTKLPLALEAIDFTDEEGTLLGLLGSEAPTGALRLPVARARLSRPLRSCGDDADGRSP